MEEQRDGEVALGSMQHMTRALIAALVARRGSEIHRLACMRMVRSLGFDGFSYLVVRPGTVGTELIRHWTTAAPPWATRYRKYALHLTDPRVTMTERRCAPLSWNLAASAGDPGMRAFHDLATRHGIAGGVAVSIERPHGERAVIAWDSSPADPTSAMGPVRCELATLVLLGCHVQDELRHLRPPTDPDATSSPLTTRESECLSLASRGFTSRDIAIKIGLAERTINFHLGNVVHKLGALNRGEAIARGIALKLINPLR